MMKEMLHIIGIVFIILAAIGLFAFSVIGFINVLIVVALISIVVNLNKKTQTN